MLFQAKTRASLFENPDLGAKRLNIATPGIMLREISRTADGVWIKVEAEFDNPFPCFVRVADVEEVTDLTFEPVDLWSFVYFSTVAAETFNQRLADASAGVSCDYILALALVLNGLEEKGLTDEVLQEFNPFHFTEPEWKQFCESSGNTSNYQDVDRFDPLAQIDGAVFATSQLTSKIVHSLTDPADVGDPRLPNSMDLFLVHVLGDAGIAALKDLATDSSRGSTLWESFVSNAGGDAAALKNRYPNFLDGQDKTSVDQVLGLIETAFGKAYVKVAEIVAGVFPEDVPQTGGPPKWLEIARQEEAKHIARPSPDIVNYFKFIDFGSGATPNTPWCGAFAGFCMKNAGQPVPKGAAAARSWNKWGKPFPIGAPAEKIPQGAVVVFSRGTDPNKGHVSFFVSGDSTHVRMLGGNQSHEVNETVFPRFNIIGIRLPADMPSDASGDVPSGAHIDFPPGASRFQRMAPVIMDKLMAKFPPLRAFQAAGVLGNIGEECGGFTQLTEVNPIGPVRGIGWCQWTSSPRRENFIKFCQERGVSTTSFEGNYGYLELELTTTFNKVVDLLRATQRLEEAVAVFETNFEFPKKSLAYRPDRIKFANIALDAFNQRPAQI